MTDWNRRAKPPRYSKGVNRAYESLPATKPAGGRVSKLGMPATTLDTPQISITIRSQQSRPSPRKPSMPKMPWDKAT